ncbi:MAG: Alpha-D-kanosaminyltransferase [Firmicutes bacterium ADurb.Bin456]|nr:MAG: Alpha-D-kanosaminyltransferase [Firmicutes bacterium ADurb.Bin456]
MRVVNLVTQMEAAGAQQVAMNITALLRKKGYEAETWFLYLKRPAYRDYRGVRVILNRKPSFFLDYVLIFWRLIMLMYRQKPEVVITHTYYANILGQIAARLLGIKARLAVQHNPAHTYPKIARLLDRVLGNLGFYKFNVVVSKAVLNSFNSYSALYRKRLKLIFYGIPGLKLTLNKELARRKFGLPPKCPLLVNVGRLAAQKNQMLLIRLLKHWPELHLAIAGEGELRDGLEIAARSLGVADRLFLLGELPPEEIGNFLLAGDVFVFPSVYEATGLAMVEAMQNGLPVVASDVPGIREVLEGEEGSLAGILVTPGDEPGFGRAIKSILAGPELVNLLLKRSRIRAKFYCVTRMVDNYERCFQELLP